MKVKIGDNVFDIQYGWLKITEFNDRFLKATNTNSGEHTYYLNGLEYGNDIYPLMEVISYRYRKTLPTILTTNLNEKQIIDRYGLRLQDRLDEQYDKIIYKNSSFRKLNKQ